MLYKQSTKRLVCLAITYERAPVAIREQLALNIDLGRRLATTDELDSEAEIVVLSTCNRLEIYLATSDYRPWIEYLAENIPEPAGWLDDYGVILYGRDVVTHLCRVAAGLESMVLGEAQILGQVIAAYEQAVADRSIGRQLKLLFLAAISAGKRARSGTAIGQNGVSLSSAAIDVIKASIGTLHNRQVLLLGAGEMVQQALKRLYPAEPRRIVIANRTISRARILADQFEGMVSSLEPEVLRSHLVASDIVIAATASLEPIIRAEFMHDVMAARQQRPLALVDLALPRDIDEAVRSIEGVTLFNLDDLHQKVETARALRAAEIPMVEQIIGREIGIYDQKVRESAVQPVISDLRQRAEHIRQRELARTLRYLPSDLDTETRQHIEHLSQSIINKLFHEPTKRLRQEASQGDADPYIESLRYLFALES